MPPPGSANAATQLGQRSLLIIAALLLLVGLGHGQTAPLIANVSARNDTSLNGDWRWIPMTSGRSTTATAL